MDLEVYLGNKLKFLYYGLEGYSKNVIFPLTEGEDTNEYYQLTQCCNNLPVEMDGLPVRFKFSGAMSNSIHPDDLLGKVITKITDESQNEFTGCFILTDVTCVAEYKTIDWEEFFFKADTVKTCNECLPIPPAAPITNTKVIYAEAYFGGINVKKVIDIKCSFANTVYRQMMEKRMGVAMHISDDIEQSVIDHFVLKMDLVENAEMCCPN